MENTQSGEDFDLDEHELDASVPAVQQGLRTLR